MHLCVLQTRVQCVFDEAKLPDIMDELKAIRESVVDKEDKLAW